jgi:hypothetical protein
VVREFFGVPGFLTVAAALAQCWQQVMNPFGAVAAAVRVMEPVTW